MIALLIRALGRRLEFEIDVQLAPVNPGGSNMDSRRHGRHLEDTYGRISIRRRWWLEDRNDVLEADREAEGGHGIDPRL